MKRAFYSAPISSFLKASELEIIGSLSSNSEFPDEPTQKRAWLDEITILKESLGGIDGFIHFEYSIPRMGSRIDVLIVSGPVIFVLEFKVGEKEFKSRDIDQVWDYALEMKNFHESSHNQLMVPILIATNAKKTPELLIPISRPDKLFDPILCSKTNLNVALRYLLSSLKDHQSVPENWHEGRYSPTPTIIEAATYLYRNHSVEEISRKDASAEKLARTTNSITDIIANSRANKQKAICFVTGIPGAGKTLVGLNIATKQLKGNKVNKSVFLSGNGPLVAILREALARDQVVQEKMAGKKARKRDAHGVVKKFIQNVHHFRDDYLTDTNPPYDHVAIFDEAQRAWNLKQTSDFMKRKKGIAGFNMSEPEFLISCLDRHVDWAVIICLVGGGQEINTGEAGIGEWLESISRSYPKWKINVSPHLIDTEYSAINILKNMSKTTEINYNENLHLSVSMRSYRAENVSNLVKQILDLEKTEANKSLGSINKNYPIVLTRDLLAAKNWLRANARGTERYGIVVSSQALRLKPHAIDVKSPMNPVHWFLNEKSDVRSSYYLEDVATEFQVQGLELDWACVTWDADFRLVDNHWEHWSFVGTKWNRIIQDERKKYLKNAYRVLLTRARQGMVIVVPRGDEKDPTRNPEYYNETYSYLREIGLQEIK